MSAACLLSLTSCLEDGSETIQLPGEVFRYFGNTDIPDDSMAGETPGVSEDDMTTTIANISAIPVDENGVVVMNVDLTGIMDPVSKEWIKLYGTGEPNQNVWLDVDGQPKGVKVYNNGDAEGSDRARLVDLVFLVDNSGSMSDEADAIARDIIAWSTKLQNSGLDIKFGCVGYGHNVGSNNYSYLENNYGVSGALNISDASTLSQYFSRSSGTSRTVGYYGPDASNLQRLSQLSQYSKAGGECGIQALRFADENFSFRKNANRIYVNFTDDANYHGTSEGLKVNYLKTSWSAQQGTVHTVFSGNKESVSGKRYGDAPWLMSDYTGGTTIFAPGNFSGVTLNSLPVTGAMQNSYILRFTNIEDKLDGKSHNVRITVLTPNKSVAAVRNFTVRFYRP